MVDDRKGGAAEQEGKEAEGEFVVVERGGHEFGEGDESLRKNVAILERAGEDLGEGFVKHGVGKKGFVEPERSHVQVLAEAEGDSAEDQKGGQEAGKGGESGCWAVHGGFE